MLFYSVQYINSLWHKFANSENYFAYVYIISYYTEEPKKLI
jgi:hypothetical protein